MPSVALRCPAHTIGLRGGKGHVGRYWTHHGCIPLVRVEESNVARRCTTNLEDAIDREREFERDDRHLSGRWCIHDEIPDEIPSRSTVIVQQIIARSVHAGRIDLIVGEERESAVDCPREVATNRSILSRELKGNELCDRCGAPVGVNVQAGVDG